MHKKLDISYEIDYNVYKKSKREAFQETQIERKKEKKMDYFTKIEKLNELREWVDRTIDAEEWNKIETHQYNAEDFYIENPWNGKKYKITTRDTEETLRAAMEDISTIG